MGAMLALVLRLKATPLPAAMLAPVLRLKATPLPAAMLALVLRLTATKRASRAKAASEESPRRCFHGIKRPIASMDSPPRASGLQPQRLLLAAFCWPTVPLVYYYIAK